jgi:hypothetical protein
MIRGNEHRLRAFLHVFLSESISTIKEYGQMLISGADWFDSRSGTFVRIAGTELYTL